MPSFISKEGRHFVSYITGPAHILLGIKFTDQTAEPKLIMQPPIGSCSHEPLDELKIREAVQEVLAAFRTDGAKIFAEEILYVENDTPRYDLFRLAAYQLTARYLENGEFEARV
jgi:hypothetical protein